MAFPFTIPSTPSSLKLGEVHTPLPTWPWADRSHPTPLQGTLQKFLDDLFKAILSIREDKPPLAVKYFFDFLEEQAEKRGISDPDTLHIWKTNRLVGQWCVGGGQAGRDCGFIVSTWAAIVQQFRPWSLSPPAWIQFLFCHFLAV